MSEQIAFDFDAPPDPEWELQQRWAKNEKRERERWTDEARCILWACGCEDRDWWNSLPKYQQHSWMQRYLCERETADLVRGGRMLSARHVIGMEEEHFAHRRKLAESWAADIRKAFIEGRRCPIKPEPQYHWVLQWAFELAQVPPACLETDKKESEVAA